MKNIFKILTVLVLSSCMNMSETQPELNINYPAAYVVNGESSTLSVINLNTNEVSATIQLTDESGMQMTGMNMGAFLAYPHHIYLNPSKTQVIVAAPGVDLSGGHSSSGSSHSSGGHSSSGVAMKGKVAVLDAMNGSNIKVFEAVGMNHNAIYSPDGLEIWTSLMDTKGKVLIYDANTYTLKNTIEVGAEPAEITFAHDGSTAFVANGGSNSVSVINPNSKKVIATIPVGLNPVGAWTGADNRMYVDNEDGQSVSIIDVKTLKVSETISLGFIPGYVAYHAEMKEMWVSDPKNEKVHWWTKTTDGTMKYGGAVDTGDGSHAIAFKDMKAYVTNQYAASVTVIDIMQHKLIKNIKVGKNPNGIVIK